MLTDKIAVIYGGSGAIGGAVARVFACEGAKVFIAGRTRARLDVVAREIAAAGGTVETAEVDSLDEQAVQEHAAAVSRKAGGIDVALNAVSFVHDQGTAHADFSINTFMLPIDQFLRSLFITSKAVLPHMGKKRRGVVLVLSEPGAKMAAPGHLGHCVASAGKEAFSRVLAAELAGKNIRVNCIRPHAIVDAPAGGSYTKEVFTPKAAAAGLSDQEWLAGAAQGTTLLKRLPTLADVAEVAAFLASDRAGAITASVANLTCGAITD